MNKEYVHIYLDHYDYLKAIKEAMKEIKKGESYIGYIYGDDYYYEEYKIIPKDELVKGYNKKIAEKQGEIAELQDRLATYEKNKENSEEKWWKF